VSAGQFLFTVNTGPGKISRHQIAHDGALTLLGSTRSARTAGSAWSTPG
jgi:hypothetical protein